MKERVGCVLGHCCCLLDITSLNIANIFMCFYFHHLEHFKYFLRIHFMLAAVYFTRFPLLSGISDSSKCDLCLFVSVSS